MYEIFIDCSIDDPEGLDIPEDRCSSSDIEAGSGAEGA